MKILRALGRAFMGAMGWLVTLGLTGVIIACVAGMLLFEHYSKDLPDYRQLENYNPATVTRLYSADGRLLAEYATEKRVFVPLPAIPRHVIQAFLSAEDKNFYQHTGVDLNGIGRALYTNILHYGRGRSLAGGSTITQQVVKNFLLTDEKSFQRKVKEAIIAMRISKVYSKDKILELYLNEIYLGLRSYGVAAAALNYFDKPLEELTVEEAALLAAQPKAPANYDPRRSPQAARTRRDWVIRRMQEDGYITQAQADAALAVPITLRARSAEEVARADFFAEEVRRFVAARYGESALYGGGLTVKTSLAPGLQAYADAALRKALIAYDRKRGFRGAVARLPSLSDWAVRLKEVAKKDIPLVGAQQLAVVLALEDRRVQIGLADGSKPYIPFSLMKWTRRVIADGVLGAEPKRPSDVLAVGDVVIAAPSAEIKEAWDLQQLPAVNGALVAMDPHTGRVLAMSGGYSAGNTDFNRATQAKRQPGSAFKPFVYLAGMENGLTPATLVDDAPVELSQGRGMPAWRPANYKDEYLGSVTLRMGLEKSRNTMTVRLAQMIGIEKVQEIGKRFGIYDNPPRNFSIVLGSAETTLLRLVSAYSALANGGRKVEPSLVERIDDRHGRIVYRRDTRPCAACTLASLDDVPPDIEPPLLPAEGEQIADPRAVYQVVSMLEGVVQRGTAMRALSLKRPVAGKTGTTNSSMDTWFVGFTPGMVVGVFVGYDKPQTLGKKETGGSVALPAFISFMEEALKGKPAEEFRPPPGIELIPTDINTGQPVPEEAQGRNIVREAFVMGEPLFVPGRPPPDPNAAGAEPGEIGRNDVVVVPGPEDEWRPPPLPPVGDVPMKGTGGLY